MKNRVVIFFVLLGVISCDDRHQDYKKNYQTTTLLTVEKKIIDLGLIEKNVENEVPFYYKLSNESDSTIVIHNIETSCGCVEINESPKVLLPGKHYQLKGKIVTNNILGYINKNIYVNYNRGEVIILKIKAVIE